VGLGSATLQGTITAADVQQGKQQVLHRHEFMVAIPGTLKRFVQAKFEFTA